MIVVLAHQLVAASSVDVRNVSHTHMHKLEHFSVVRLVFYICSVTLQCWHLSSHCRNPLVKTCIFMQKASLIIRLLRACSFVHLKGSALCDATKGNLNYVTVCVVHL